MDAQTLTFLILSPFVLAFLYAGFHEYRRYRSEGRATYGLVYDEETGTTRVSGIADGEDAYDPEAFDPNDYKDPDIREAPEETSEDAPEEAAEGADEETPEQKPGTAPGERPGGETGHGKSRG